MKPAIRVDNLSKRFRLGTSKSAGYRTLRETITESAAGAWHGLRRRLGGSANGNGNGSANDNAFWALKDVSFEVQPGEVVGIIGRNGAGKSTLLKILSRIVEPTAGRCEVRGRMASLLEVGTGFHPELTGRENIYMNGSILGMSRKEIDRKFDEIVAFSEIEQFLDTPVKRYSSGMYVRLAFAVAAHLDPEILVVDEVLSVGDASFQEKCIGKIGDVARSGRTVLFVSHNMQAVTRLCTRAVLMNKGQIRQQGAPQSVVEAYLGSGIEEAAEAVWSKESAPGCDVARLRAIRILNQQGRVCIDQDIAKPITVEVEFWLLKPSDIVHSSIHLLNSLGLTLFALDSIVDQTVPMGFTKSGLYRSRYHIPANLLNDGKHLVSAFVVRNKSDIVVNVPEVVSFVAHDYGTTRHGYVGKIIGAVRPQLPSESELVGEVA